MPRKKTGEKTRWVSVRVKAELLEEVRAKKRELQDLANPDLIHMALRKLLQE